MIEEQKEQKAKIEELEGHLEALMHRIQMVCLFSLWILFSYNFL